ncbi:tRNA nucleotidyltransferase/poly(A) polymerase [Roseimaritima multifibrata]|uniref:tRNA nucleotidyltransferase/poly(A) polymerase n=1 Tax=Roseimaritima multifibrata TaxID=1930274 RepID=A0A517MDD1_9BACT|nr:CCA tRNA nucleotidyltransferase [Roseimaritima multifibrata]QDS92899.1 tRNA nucleotidyltransferase/poly(A) polymerase [Roseimaritima multifibrata]
MLIRRDESSAHAFAVLEKLATAGHTAFLAGGCVRDALLGIHPKDFDIATDATPTRVQKIFGKGRTLAIGASFGVINVLPDKGSLCQPVEVATFRSDGTYSDGRRPDSVHFGDPEQDALRRDFTINGIFYDPLADKVIDFVGGQADLQEQVIRAIGDADQRFAEDKLRMLRAVRFASLLQFRLQPATAQAVRQFAPQIDQVSGERIGAEMRRMLASPRANHAIKALEELELAPHLLPTAARSGQVSQEWLTWLQARRNPDTATAIAMLGIPDRHAYDQNQTASIIQQLFHTWKLSTHERDAALFAASNYSHFAQADKLPWSTVQPLLVHRDSKTALEVAAASLRATDELSGIKGEGIRFVEQRLSWPQEQLDPPPLIDGQTLKKLGLRPGPRFREILQAVRAAQLDEELNSPEAACEWMRSTGLLS